MSDPITACPRCGSTSGYRFEAAERVIRAGAWGKPSEMVETHPVWPKNARCVDCHGLVNLQIAEGSA